MYFEYLPCPLHALRSLSVVKGVNKNVFRIIAVPLTVIVLSERELIV